MREASNSEEVVRSRLRSVLDATGDSARDPGGPRRPPLAPAGPASAPLPSSREWPTGEEGPLAWSDLIPSWPDDVELDEAQPDPASGLSDSPLPAFSASPGSSPLASSRPLVGPLRAEPVYAWQYEDGAEPLPSEPSGPALRRGHPDPASRDFDDESDSQEAAEAVRRVGLGAFDPGRPGVKALAAVAVLVVLVAAFFAWRARPHVDPVPPVPSSTATLAGGDAPLTKASAGGEVVIAVAGKVKKPGLVRLPAGSRVADALQAAGGAQAGVDVSVLNLARKVIDGELIMVGVSAPPGAAVAAGPAGVAGAAPGLINLNAATLSDLDTLPGVGPVLAQRILDAREAQGGFTSVSDLRKVDGIGDARFEQLKDLVTV